ncbi:MAG: NUDIX domain-containing protein, partial [Treponema sp.]|nr:NUDIX domain-containing protein [Treponema sp.]
MINNHFTATGIVFNKYKQILMIFHKKLQVWLPPGGHIEPNELPDAAVLREIFEETRIKAEIIPEKQNLFLTHDNCQELERPFIVLLEDIEGNGKHNHIDMVYICRSLNEDYTLQESKVSDIGWYTSDEIKNLKTFENVVK